MTSADGALDDLRREVDDIDVAIHDLIMRRTELARGASAAKGSGPISPAREAQVLRALVARHCGTFPTRVLVRLWREMISAQAALQGPFAVAAYAPGEGPDLRRVARDHYGSETPIVPCELVPSVLRQVTERQAVLGVLPLPQDEEQDPWWRHLARRGAAVPQVVARLPFATPASGSPEVVEGLVIALAEHEPSGLDRSWIVVETGDELSRSKLSRTLSDIGLPPVNIQSWSDPSGFRLHLIEVDGFVADTDERLVRLTGREEAEVSQAWAIGGYAVPLAPEQLAGRAPQGGA